MSERNNINVAGLHALVNHKHTKDITEIKKVEMDMIMSKASEYIDIDFHEEPDISQVKEEYGLIADNTARTILPSFDRESQREPEFSSQSFQAHNVQSYNQPEYSFQTQNTQSFQNQNTQTYNQPEYSFQTQNAQSFQNQNTQTYNQPEFSAQSPRMQNHSYNAPKDYFMETPMNVETPQSYMPLHQQGERPIARTGEQQDYDRVNNIINSMGADFNAMRFSEEHEAAAKETLLSEIVDLEEDLIANEVNLENIPQVDKTSAYVDIQHVHNMLKRKLDNLYAANTGEELAMMLAYGLETIFDGNRVIFNKYRPDLTGFNQDVKVKMQRCRNDTGKIVKNVMQSVNGYPIIKLLFEIIPSAVRRGTENAKRRSYANML